MNKAKELIDKVVAGADPDKVLEIRPDAPDSSIGDPATFIVRDDNDRIHRGEGVLTSEPVQKRHEGFIARIELDRKVWDYRPNFEYAVIWDNYEGAWTPTEAPY